MNRKLFDIGPARDRSTQESTTKETLRSLPDVPVLSETLLLMELMVRQRCVDLAQVSELILTDLGATLQVLRLAGRECSFPPNFPYRIEDCISDLGLDACLEAMSQHIVTRSTRHSALVASWAHAREISSYCGSVARQMFGDLSPEDACLVGLCHDLGTLPAALGWNFTLPTDKNRAGFKIADAWRLPSCVLQYFSSFMTPEVSNRWSELVDRAHEELVSTQPQHAPYDFVAADSDSWAGLQVASS